MCACSLHTRHQFLPISHCCDLTFRADSRQNLILEHLHIIEVLMHANATIMFKEVQMFTLNVMMPLQFELSVADPAAG